MLKIIAVLAALFLPGTALAACPGVMADCPAGSNTRAEIAPIGLKADGVTSDDVALKALVDQCAANGGRLVLPAGRIVLSGAAGPITLKNCAIQGTGVPAGQASTASLGTMIMLTSTTVRPFICNADFSLSGINFYWPNQTTGTTVYPPLISDPAAATGAGSAGCAHAFFDHLVIVNAYDFLRAQGNWGDIIFSNSTMYAVHDLFAIASTGDSFALTNMRFTPGPWLDMTSFSSTTTTALNTADTQNSLFHVLSSNPPTLGVTLAINNSETEAWRWGILIDNGGTWGASSVNMLWDGTGTLIDTTPGGTYVIQNEFKGSNSGCFSPRWDGTPLTAGITYPCFVLNNKSSLALSNFFGGVNKDFIQLAGGELELDHVVAGPVGSIADGNDYYLVKVTSGTPIIFIRNSNFSGHNLPGPVGDPHAHGISTLGHIPLRFVIENNFFVYFNDDITADSSGGTTLISGNSSGSDVATAITIAGLNGVVYTGNQWNSPPTSVASACGAGCLANGAFSGFIQIGTPAPVSSGTLTLPWMPYGPGGGACRMQVNGSAIGVASSSPSPRVWNWSTEGAVNIAGSQLFFNCPSAQ